MLASRRWREWGPQKNGGKSPESEPPKPPKTILSVLTVPTLSVPEKVTEPGRIPSNDPAEWREPFARWLDSACARLPRVFGGVAALHLGYCEWEIAQSGVPCTRETFERLLRERDFLMGEVEGTLLVSGLAFQEDIVAAGL